MNYFLLVLLPHLDRFLGTLGILGLIICVLSSLPILCAYGEEDERFPFIFKRFLQALSFSVFLIFLTIPIPSKTELVQLRVVNILDETKGLDKIPQKIVDRISKLLDLVEDKNKDES